MPAPKRGVRVVNDISRKLIEKYEGCRPQTADFA